LSGKLFDFEKMQIPVGAELLCTVTNDKLKVVGKRKISYQDQEMYLTNYFALKLGDKKGTRKSFSTIEYNGINFWEIYNEHIR
jgi:hypothetical protein